MIARDSDASKKFYRTVIMGKCADMDTRNVYGLSVSLQFEAAPPIFILGEIQINGKTAQESHVGMSRINVPCQDAPPCPTHG